MKTFAFGFSTTRTYLGDINIVSFNYNSISNNDNSNNNNNNNNNKNKNICGNFVCNIFRHTNGKTNLSKLYGNG